MKQIVLSFAFGLTLVSAHVQAVNQQVPYSGALGCSIRENAERADSPETIARFVALVFELNIQDLVAQEHFFSVPQMPSGYSEQEENNWCAILTKLEELQDDKVLFWAVQAAVREHIERARIADDSDHIGDSAGFDYTNCCVRD